MSNRYVVESIIGDRARVVDSVLNQTVFYGLISECKAFILQANSYQEKYSNQAYVIASSANGLEEIRASFGLPRLSPEYLKVEKLHDRLSNLLGNAEQFQKDKFERSAKANTHDRRSTDVKGLVIKPRLAKKSETVSIHCPLTGIIATLANMPALEGMSLEFTHPLSLYVNVDRILKTQKNDYLYKLDQMILAGMTLTSLRHFKLLSTDTKTSIPEQNQMLQTSSAASLIALMRFISKLDKTKAADLPAFRLSYTDMKDEPNLTAIVEAYFTTCNSILYPAAQVQANVKAKAPVATIKASIAYDKMDYSVVTPDKLTNSLDAKVRAAARDSREQDKLLDAARAQARELFKVVEQRLRATNDQKDAKLVGIVKNAIANLGTIDEHARKAISAGLERRQFDEATKLAAIIRNIHIQSKMDEFESELAEMRVSEVVDANIAPELAPVAKKKSLREILDEKKALLNKGDC